MSERRPPNCGGRSRLPVNIRPFPRKRSARAIVVLVATTVAATVPQVPAYFAAKANQRAAELNRQATMRKAESDERIGILTQRAAELNFKASIRKAESDERIAEMRRNATAPHR